MELFTLLGYIYAYWHWKEIASSAEGGSFQHRFPSQSAGQLS